MRPFDSFHRFPQFFRIPPLPQILSLPRLETHRLNSRHSLESLTSNSRQVLTLVLSYPLNSTLQLGLLASTPLTQFPLPRPCALSPAAAPKPFESSTNKMLLSCIVSVHSKPFQINTCKTGSKQTALTTFRINTSWGRTHFAQFWCNVTPCRNQHLQKCIKTTDFNLL